MLSLSTPDILKKIAELAADLTPPSDIAVLLGIDPDIFKTELADKHSQAHEAYFRAKAETAHLLRKQELEFARVGSPLAVQMTGSFLHDMTADEDF